MPQKLADVPTPSRALPLQMPMKYTGRASASTNAGAGAQKALEQVNFMRYTNPSGGTAYGKDERDRDAVARRMRGRLMADEVEVGSVIAVHRSQEDPTEPGGYGTPFYVAEVLDIQLKPVQGCSSDDDDARREIENLFVHYRMPMFNSSFCDDVQRPFVKACVGQHAWGVGCEKRTRCVVKRPEGSTTSRHAALIDAATVFEINVDLKKNGALSAISRSKLAETNRDWAAQLGVEMGESGKKKTASKKRKHK